MSRIGLWFEALEEMGEEASLEVGFTHWKNDQYKHFSHSNHDGIAALISFLKDVDPKINFDDITPSVPSRIRPSFFIQARGLVKYMLRLPLNGARIKKQKQKKDYKKSPSKKAFLYFTEDETLLYEKIIKSKKISMNAWFIFCLSQAVKPLVENDVRPQIWMIPISLRDLNTNKYNGGLVSGFVDSYIYREDDPLKIHAEMKNKIKNEDAWGGYLGFSFSSLLGKWFLKLLVKNNYRFQMRMGVFTNVGKWGDTNIKNNFPKDFIGYAPAVYENPIAAVAMTWMGKTWISIKVHSSIDIENQQVKKILDDWKNLILNASQ